MWWCHVQTVIWSHLRALPCIRGWFDGCVICRLDAAPGTVLSILISYNLCSSGGTRGKWMANRLITAPLKCPPVCHSTRCLAPWAAAVGLGGDLLLLESEDSNSVLSKAEEAPFAMSWTYSGFSQCWQAQNLMAGRCFLVGQSTDYCPSSGCWCRLHKYINFFLWLTRLLVTRVPMMMQHGVKKFPYNSPLLIQFYIFFSCGIVLFLVLWGRKNKRSLCHFLINISHPFTFMSSLIWTVSGPWLILLHEQIFYSDLVSLVTVLWTIFRQTTAFWGGWHFCIQWHVHGASDTVRRSLLSKKQGRPPWDQTLFNGAQG